MPPIKFWLNPTYGLGGDVVWRISWWPGHLWYRNGMILAVLNLYVATMPPIKFRLNLSHGLGEDLVERISRWPPWRQSWISEWNEFSYSESLCHCDASHQVSTQSDLRFARRCRLNNFQDGGHLGYQNGTIVEILTLHVATISPTKFQLNPTYESEDVENLKS